MNNCLRLVSHLALNIASVFYGVYAIAQVIPDSTTDTVVDTNGNSFDINQGDRAGNNLFHSFTEFSLPNGGIASFNNQADIVNIFSRVTGGNISDINGLIRANGTANVFIINPAGIIFGENASLDIGGSFYASSASSIIFNEGEFSTTETETPPLLTINAPIGLNFQNNLGDIINRSGSIDNDSLASDRNGLEVATGNNIALLGGNINFDGGKITAPGGRVELGGLLAAGEIGINPDLSFSFPLGIERADVNLTDFASVNVTGSGGGFINVNAKNLTLTGQSELFAGIAENMGSPNAQAGDITINATESIQLIGSDDDTFATESDDLDTSIRNQVGLPPQIGSNDFNSESPRNPQSESTAQGNAGSIIAQTDRFEISDRATLTAKIYGQGDTGNIVVKANEIILDGASFVNQVREGGRGNAGNITVDTKSLSALDLSFIISNISGVGDGGDIKIDASEQFSISGRSQLNVQIQPNGEGNAGDIEINTVNFSLIDGADIFANVRGEGEGGNIVINAREQITIEGTSDNYSDVFISVGSNARGNVGDIKLDSQILNISNGTILSFTNGKGDAGNILINASDLVLLDGSNGNADVGITQLNVQVQSDGEGNAGNIEIDTNNFSLEGGAFVLANTQGNGDGGNIDLNADETVIIEDVSGIFTSTNVNRDAGDIIITTQKLTLSKGSQIVARTSGTGNAGNLTVTASDSINLTGNAEERRSGLFANAIESSGNGGNLTVNTKELTIEDGATITTGNFPSLNLDESGTGQPGNISISANSISLDSQGRIEAATQSEIGAGANIDLKITEDLVLQNNSFISARAFNEANGGNLTIDSRFIIAFPSSGDGNDIIANAEQGNGGSININAKSLFGIEERPNNPNTNDINASSEFGLDGVVKIDTPEINPNQGLRELPTTFAVPKPLQGCQASREKNSSSFINTGRGGLPPNPYESLDNSNMFVDVQLPSKWTEDSAANASTSTKTETIVEADKWVVNKNGNVELVAHNDLDTTVWECGDP